MQVEEAIARAKSHVEQVFAAEDVSQIRLEEVEYDENDSSWAVTLSMVRPSAPNERWGALVRDVPQSRAYRTVKIDDAGARFPSVKIRPMLDDD